VTFHRCRQTGRAAARGIRRMPLFACCLLLAACVSTTPPRRDAGFRPPTTIAVATTLAPPAMDPELEIELLSKFKTAPALLRVAHLQLTLRRSKHAIDACAEVLYGPVKPSAHDEAFARYLRAEAHELAGNPERGAFDRERAAELAIDFELRKLLAAKAPPAEGAPVASPSLVVQPRSAWSARAPDRGNVEPMTAVHRVTIHHSALAFYDTTPKTCAAQLQRIQKDHMQTRGYGDIGYHYLIDPSGRIWQGRDLRFQGAHASGSNNVGNVGVCLLGNFVRGKAGQAPTSAQVQAMRRLVGSLMQRYGFGPDGIHCHSDFKATDCPGPLMEPVVASMVRDLRRSGAQALAAASALP
jgi:hypothetical protein